MAKYYELHEDVLPILKKQRLNTNVNDLFENVIFYIGGQDFDKNTNNKSYYCFIEDFEEYEQQLIREKND